MDISATDRNPEPGDNPLLFSTESNGSFRCTQPQTVMHTTKPLLNHLHVGTTGICPHRSNQPTQDSNPGPSDHESQTLCVSPPSEDRVFLIELSVAIAICCTTHYILSRNHFTTNCPDFFVDWMCYLFTYLHIQSLWLST